MAKQNPHRSKIHDIVSQFVPQLLAISPAARQKYLYELDRCAESGKILPREETRVRHILAAIALLEEEEAPPQDDRRFSTW